MKRSLDDTAARFDAMSTSYDDDRTDQQAYTALRVVEAVLGAADADSLVVDVGTGTGAVALHVAPHVDRVVGLDVSDGMLERARAKAEAAGIGNVRFAHGRFRDLEREVALDGVDVVTSSFAMHHLADDEKREAIAAIADVLAPDGTVVIGDLVIFDGETDAGHYDPEVDDPSTADFLEDAFRDAGFGVEITRLGQMTGMVVAHR